MSDKYAKVEEEFAEKIVKLFERQGFNPTVMKIYITLFMSTKPLGLKEISEGTGYSMSTVCNTMDIVERTMDVRNFKKPGSKRVYYECLHDLMLVHHKRMDESERETETMIGILKDAEENLKSATDHETAAKRAHIRRLREGYERYHDVFHKFVEMVSAIHKSR
ncbi:MAG: hypothetical protein V1744_06300 [Candidatus Altiarchaeota archaeon]